MQIATVTKPNMCDVEVMSVEIIVVENASLMGPQFNPFG